MKEDNRSIAHLQSSPLRLAPAAVRRASRALDQYGDFERAPWKLMLALREATDRETWAENWGTDYED